MGYGRFELPIVGFKEKLIDSSPWTNESLSFQ